MEYEDRLRIPTAEGVDLDVVLAGLGSRFAALLVDTVIQVVVVGAAGLVLGLLGDLGAAVFAVVAFLVFFGYPVLFEVVGGGRTPGKRLTGLRVVGAEGGPVAFVPSAVRNVLRLVDALPGTYTVGMVAVLATARNQRLGDLAAGTLVVRDRVAVPDADLSAPVTVELPPDAATWDLSAVSAEEVATVRAFLLRRPQLTPEARGRIGADLAGRLVPRVVGPPTAQGPERFLELVVTAKDARSR